MDEQGIVDNPVEEVPDEKVDETDVDTIAPESPKSDPVEEEDKP